MSAEQKSLTDAAFRGHRRYLHSTTLFPEMLNYLRAQGIEQPTEIDFQFSTRTANQVWLTTAPVANAIAEFRCSDATVYAEDSGRPIERIEPYDEAAIVSRFAFRSGDCHVSLAETDVFIDSLVAAFKAVLLRRDPSRQYVFARVRLAYLPEDSFVVRYGRSVGRLYEGIVAEADGREIGRIYYGAWS